MADEIKYLDSLPEVLRDSAAQQYFEAFREKLGPILDGERAVQLLSRTFNADRAICAVAADVLVGLAGVHYDGRALVGIRLTNMRAEYGWVGGATRYLLLGLLDRTPQPRELLMDGIVVHPEHRGRGIGSQLLVRVVELARQRGYRTVRLDVVDTNPNARRLYERHGFAATKTTTLPWLRRWLGFGAATTMVRSVVD